METQIGHFFKTQLYIPKILLIFIAKRIMIYDQRVGDMSNQGFRHWYTNHTHKSSTRRLVVSCNRSFLIIYILLKYNAINSPI